LHYFYGHTAYLQSKNTENFRDQLSIRFFLYAILLWIVYVKFPYTELRRTQNRVERRIMNPVCSDIRQ